MYKLPSKELTRLKTISIMLIGLTLHLNAYPIQLPAGLHIRSTDICDNLQLTIDNQLNERYVLEVANITYKKGEGDHVLQPGSQARYTESLKEIMHPGFTLYGLLHGQIEAYVLVHILDKEVSPGEQPVVDTFKLDIDAHGSGKIYGLCIINTNINIQEVSLADSRKALVTVERQGQDMSPPRIKVGVWRLAR